jgi:hypothetical protein
MRAAKLETLVDELTPISRLRIGHGLMLVAFATMLAALFALFVLGARAHLGMVMTSTPGMVRAATLLGLGTAAAFEAMRMMRPTVGRSATVGRWVLTATFALPGAALIFAAARERSLYAAIAPGTWLWCLATIGGLAIGIGLFLVAWLRRGAPTNLARVGWLTGIAAGSLGTFAYSLSCPHGNMSAIAIWYSVAVAGAAVLGRLVVPPLIRW